MRNWGLLTTWKEILWPLSSLQVTAALANILTVTFYERPWARVGKLGRKALGSWPDMDTLSGKENIKKGKDTEWRGGRGTSISCFLKMLLSGFLPGSPARRGWDQAQVWPSASWKGLPHGPRGGQTIGISRESSRVWRCQTRFLASNFGSRTSNQESVIFLCSNKMKMPALAIKNQENQLGF